VSGRRGGDSQVRKSRALAFAAGAIGQPTGNSRGDHVKRQNATALAAANARCSHGMDISSSKCEFPAEHRGDVSHPPYFFPLNGFTVRPGSAESTQKGAFWGNAAHVNAWAA
jgi:hypothetical protein